MVKKLCIFFSILIAMFSLSSCGYVTQVNEMAYVVGLGVDKADNDNILLSLQFAKPMSVSSKEGGGENKSTSLVSAKGSDIFSAMSILESSLSKQINLTHTKIILFSDEILKSGIESHVKMLMANQNIRPNTYCALSLGGANIYLETVKPALELNPAKYYTLMFSKDTKSIVPNTTLKDLYFSFTANDKDAVLPIVSVLDKNSMENKNEKDDYIAGESAKKTENKTDNAGVAFLKGDKLAKILPTSFSENYNILSGDFKVGYYSFKINDEIVTVKLNLSKKPKFCTKINKNMVSTKIKICMSLSLVSQTEILGKLSENELLEKINENILNEMNTFFATTKEYNVDVLGIKSHLKRNFLTNDSYNNFITDFKLQNCYEDITLETKISGKGLVS